MFFRLPKTKVAGPFFDSIRSKLKVNRFKKKTVRRCVSVKLLLPTRDCFGSTKTQDGSTLSFNRVEAIKKQKGTKRRDTRRS